MNNNIWNLIFSFEKLVAPKVQKLVYIIGFIGGIIGGLLGVLGGIEMLTHSPALGLGTIMLSLIATAIGLLFWRIFCEMWIVYFGIYDRLGDIREVLSSKK